MFSITSFFVTATHVVSAYLSRKRLSRTENGWLEAETSSYDILVIKSNVTRTCKKNWYSVLYKQRNSSRKYKDID